MKTRVNNPSCRERTYPLRLASGFETCYLKYVRWLKHLLERLGREPALEVWHTAFPGKGDDLLDEILSAGWEAVADEPVDVETRISDALTASFGPPVEGVTAAEARGIVERGWPITQVRQRFSDLNLMCEVTTYQSLHLFHKGLAMLAEALIDGYGKQGELIAYDCKLDWVQANSGVGMEATEFLGLFKMPLDPRSFQGAGLEYRLVQASESEVVLHIDECELARYYLEHHPRVGYMMACSMDEAEYRAVSEGIRMQRTSTLMEGGDLCDFRIYAPEEQDDER